MLSRRLQHQISQAALGQTFSSLLVGTEVAIEVQIQQIAWHETKPIVIGRVVDSDDPLWAGEQYLGTLAKIFAQRPELFSEISMSQTEADYCNQPLDLENGQTSHEISYRIRQSLASAR